MDTHNVRLDYSVGSAAFWYTILAFTTFAVLKYLEYKQKFYGNFRKPTRVVKFHTLEVTIERVVTVRYLKKEQECLVTRIGTFIPDHVACAVVEKKESLLLEFKDHANLTITHRITDQNYHVYEFSWVACGSTKRFEDHVSMTEADHWYGVGHVFHQRWPMEKWYHSFGAFVVKETPPFGTTFGEVQERMWLTSSGVAMVVDFDVPLFVSTNHDHNKTIRMLAEYKAPYQNVRGQSEMSKTLLKYTIIQTNEDALSAFKSLRQTSIIPVPSGIPDEEMFRRPIWSTWAQFKKAITQSNVEEFAKDIKKHGFSAAQLEIDDDWTSHYGDWDFDKRKFPNPKAMVESLKSMGFRVNIWVHPFASPQSSAFWEGLKHDKEIWTRWNLGLFKLPALVSWWNGYGAVLDVTNKKAVDWFRQKMQRLRDVYGISSFKIDGGEGGRLSRFSCTKEPMESPNVYTKLFAQLAHSLDTETRSQEIRVGVQAQDLPMFFRLQDKDSNWTNFNGLKTIIPHVLTQGLIGYPFVLPDMIGGNAYFGGRPDRELYIRWVELNALLPSMQFSIAPWDYDDETVKICKKMCKLHEKYSDKIIALAKEATQSGAPIIRPVWWIAPKDEAALTTSSEFLLGDDILVAPVLEKGARVRDIYLPAGLWTDEIYNNQLEGGRWYRDYPAELDQLPHFTRL